MIIEYQRRCKGWHGKWVNKGDLLEVTRSAARTEIDRGVALPEEDSDLYPQETSDHNEEQDTTNHQGD